METPTVKERGSYIGGSEAAAVLGLNRYQPIYDVWRKKTSDEEGDDLEGKHIQRGNYVEPLIEQVIKDEYDSTCNSVQSFLEHDAGVRQLTQTNAETRYITDYAIEQVNNGKQIFLRHPEYPFIGGHPDGVGEEILWEFKSPAMRNLERVYKEGISVSWYYQVQHYLLCTGLERGAVAMWDYDEWAPYIVWIDADKRLHERMIERYADFWEDVELGVPPIAVNEFHHDQLTVVSDQRINDLLGRYKEAYEWRYYGKNQQKKLKGKILSLANGRKTLITDHFRASIAEVDNGSYSYTRLTVKEKE